MQRSASVRASGGVIVFPAATQGTCRSGAVGATIDYFVVDAALEKRILSVWIDEEWPSAPRKPAGLRLDMEPMPLMECSLQKCKAFP